MSNYKRQHMRVSFSNQKGKHIQQIDKNTQQPSFQNPRKRVKIDQSLNQSQPQQIPSNDSGIILFKTNNQEQYDTKDLSPWLSKRTSMINDSLLRFHNEIIEFYNYIKPSKIGHLNKMKKFNLIKQYILNLFPNSDVIYFGSFATQLYLPDGDIDLAVLTNSLYDPPQVYNKINKFLSSSQNSHLFTNVQYIKSSKVPLIKFNYNNTLFDLSVDKTDGIHQLKYIQKINTYYPQFKYLTFIFKCLLKIRGMSDTYTGGIGSFLLSCLLLVYLVNVQKNKHYFNLGQHVIQFMKFYSFRDQQYWQTKLINVREGLILSRRSNGVYFSCLSPQDDNHDIGKSAYKIKGILKVFKNRCAYILDNNYNPGQSILRSLLNPYDQPFRYLKKDLQ